MTRWISPPAVFTLLPRSLQIWRARLDICSDSLPRYSELLSHGELARADRFVFPQDRQRFVTCRATLRLLLGNYLQIPPQSVLLEEGPQGKPIVAGSDLAPQMKFNLSHSHGIAVFAFAKEREVGIDVEKIRPDFASHEIAQRYFSSQEIAELDALAPQLYTAGFFRCWTKKEAYIKARGEGLQIPLDSFSVSLAPERPPQLIATDSDRWSIYSFKPLREYTAAIVAEKCDWTLSFYDGSSLL
jgi:4'-phosphopantetheinyl transferase